MTRGRKPDVPIATDALAPAANDLSPEQESFCEQYVDNGGRGRDAAIAAGYAERSAASQASRMLRKPKIQNTILRMTMERLGMQAPRALMQVSTLMNSARSEYVRLSAAQDLLDRSGFRAPERVDHRVDANLTVTFDIAPVPQVIDGEGG